jgi:pimeloyl-ACP methyl ester carboxylesterase
MATFVLVHGAWHGGWCYKRVAQRLRARGHEVYTPTLTGLGERSHLLHAGVNLSLHVQDVLNVLRWEELADVVLCGHSYGGMVVTGVAAAVPEKIASLVYLDAFVPDAGQSLWDLTRDEVKQRGLAGVGRLGGYALPPISAETFHVNPADRAWVDAQCVPQPFAAFLEPAKTGARDLAVEKRTYIFAAGYQPTSFARFHEALRTDPAWTVKTVPCGHDVMIDEPDLLTEMLIAAA